MRFTPITITDKLGREILLRGPKLSDSEALITYLRETTAETPYLIREPQEVTMTIPQEESFIQSRIEAERECMLLAFYNGELIGSCALVAAGPYARYAHRCSVSIALYKKYWGGGIGKAMMETVLSIAGSVGYDQAELEMMADNRPAKALYEKLGFVEYGRFPRNMKYEDGTYADAIWMMKLL